MNQISKPIHIYIEIRCTSQKKNESLTEILIANSENPCKVLWFSSFSYYSNHQGALQTVMYQHPSKYILILIYDLPFVPILWKLSLVAIGAPKIFSLLGYFSWIFILPGLRCCSVSLPAVVVDMASPGHFFCGGDMEE